MGSTLLIAYFHFVFLHVLLHEAVASGYSDEQKDTRSTVSQKHLHCCEYTTYLTV